jgi:hypothetical protein
VIDRLVDIALQRIGHGHTGRHDTLSTMRAALAIVLCVGATACSLFKGSESDDTAMPDAAVDGDDGNSECAQSATLVYTLESNKRLSRFDPSTGTFTQVGYVNCPGSSAFFQPFSMSVDRSGIAWILYRDQTDPQVPPQLFRYDTLTQQCDPTTWSTQLGLKLFSMGFSTDMNGSIEDTMFVSGGNDVSGTSATLATLSTSTFMASSVGTMAGWAELSGNAKGELWAYLPLGSSQSLQQINKATGASSQTFALPALTGSPNAWAFAWWGGDFWIFYKRAGDPATLIYQFDGATGAYKNVTDTNSIGVPRTIIGAGVSTCAPTMLL